MHAVAAFFASIITFVSGFFAPTVASNSPVNVRATQPAAAAATQTEIVGDPFNDPAAASAVVAPPAVSPPPPQTVINQPVIERIVERVVPQGNAGISADKLTAILADFGQSIENRIAALKPPKVDIPQQIAAAGNSAGYYFAPASQRIDSLTNTTINTPTITGGSISGASVSGYLPLSGGTLSGALSAGTLALSGTLTGTDASFSGTLTAGTLNVAGLSSQGALIGPYFTATSTTATSSFAGGLTAANNAFSILQSGNVGIGTTSPTTKLSIVGSADTTQLDITANATQSNSSPLIRLAKSDGTTLLSIGSDSKFNIFIGQDTGSANIAAAVGGQPGTANTFVGYQSGQFNTTGRYNTTLGTHSLNANTTGEYNVAVGPNSLIVNTTGSGNTAVGMHALFQNVSGSSNTAIGRDALQANTASYNVAVGAVSQMLTSSGTFNTSIGYNSLSSNTTGNSNIAVGLGAATGLTTGSSNLIIGTNSVGSSATASNEAVFGSDLSPYYNIYFGKGVTNATPAAFTVNGTGGFGTDIAGGNLQLAGGKGTGNALGGDVVFQTADAGSSGTVLQSLTTKVTLKASGNVGIGTTTPTAQLSTTGTVRFSNFGAGTLTTDASGNLSVSSDERLKNIDRAFSRGLADIVQLNPIQYHWNATSGLDTSTQYAGFSAQNVQAAIPEAVGSSTNGYLTLQDRPLIATIVNAIKELAQQVGDLAARVVTKELTFDRAWGIELDVEKLCIGSTCLTEKEIKAILEATREAAMSPSPNAPAGTPQAPVIELNGNASSTIELGDTYNDLGARIVVPDSDLNLGLIILLDGATTSAVSIDTTTPGEHTILYTVTSPTSGLTGSIMRTVIVSHASTDNPFNLATPANDNASSTPAAASI